MLQLANGLAIENDILPCGSLTYRGTDETEAKRVTANRGLPR